MIEYMNRVPRIACFNDISGFGRCSMTTAIPILSVCGVQPCPAPTALLSRHTGFPTFFFEDFTDRLPEYLKNWSESGIDFDGIYSGFLGSEKQIDIVEGYIEERRSVQNKPPLVLIDTVMGDGGRPYSTYTREMCEKMKALVRLADIITPNITEACLLTGSGYTGERISDAAARELALRLADMGAGSVVITGIRRGDSIANFTYEHGCFYEDELHCVSRSFSGTGDIFASAVCAAVINGHTLRSASRIAGEFVFNAARYTVDMETPLSEGVMFEPLLCGLSRAVADKSPDLQ